MNYLEYSLFEAGFVNRWLASDILVHKMDFEPVTLHGDMNRWLKEGFSIHENPCKTAFSASRRECAMKDRGTPGADKPPLEIELFPGGTIKNQDGSTQHFNVYYPFDDLALDLSCCENEPSRLDAWAAVVLDAPYEEESRFQLALAGSLTLWCNGVAEAEYMPYTRNQLQTFDLTLPLKKGKNTVLVHLNDLAERDCVFMLRMRYLGSLDLRQCIPIEDTPDDILTDSIHEPSPHSVSAERLHKAEQLMQSLSFSSNHFMEGSIRLQYQNLLPDMVQLTYRCATEENENGGFFHEGSVLLPPDKEHCSLGAAEEFPMGFLRCNFRLSMGNIHIDRCITAENHPQSLIPAPADNVAGRKQQALAFLASYGESNTNRSLAIFSQGGDLALAHRLLQDQVRTVNARYDCSDFYLVYFPYILKTYGNTPLLPDCLGKELEQCILDFRYWMDEPGSDVMWFFSENHALLFHTCRLLAGELFPHRTFTCSGLTGIQMAQKAETLLKDWFSSFFSEGLTEWNSSAYLPIDMLGFASIYVFAANPLLRELARKGMDFICLLLAQHSIRGILAASAGRTYPKELFGNLSNCTSAISYICFGTGTLSHAGKGILSLCLSDYEPPAEYRKWLFPAESELLEIHSVHGFQKHVRLYTEKTEAYLLTAAIDFRPGKEGYQENPFHLAFGPGAQLFISHPGEKALFGCGRPSYWAGNGSLPRVQAYGGLALLSFVIPDDHPVDFTHLYFPTMEWDEWRQEGNTLLARSGNGFCGVMCSSPAAETMTGPNGKREWIAHGRRTVWMVRVASSQLCSYEDFCRILSLSTFKADTDTLSVLYHDSLMGTVKGGWQTPLQINNTYVNYPDTDQYGTAFTRKFT